MGIVVDASSSTSNNAAWESEKCGPWDMSASCPTYDEQPVKACGVQSPLDKHICLVPPKVCRSLSTRAAGRPIGRSRPRGQAGGLSLHGVPKAFHRIEKAVRFRIVIFGKRLELPQQFLLPGRQVDRRLDRKFDEHVARRAAAQRPHALATQPHLASGLAATRDLYPAATAIDCRHFDVTTKGGRGHRHRHPAMQFRTVALEYFVRLNLDEDIEIARRSTAHSGFALSGQTDTRPRLDPGRHIDRERAFLLHTACTTTDVTGILDDLTQARTGRAGSFDCKEALRGAHLAKARTRRTGGGFRAPFGAGPLAFAAGH